MKQTDTHLMKRLLKYAWPYKVGFFVVLFFMVISTATDLLKPVLIGQAVDLFTQGYKMPLVEKTEGRTVDFRNLTLGLYEEGDEADIVYQMINVSDEYYWLTDVSLADAKALQQLTPTEFNEAIDTTGDTVTLTVAGRTYAGELLGRSDLQVLQMLRVGPLINIALLFLLVIALSFILTYYQTIMLQRIGQKIILNIREDVYEKMIMLPSRFYHNNPIGKLVTRVTNDTETLNEMYTNVLVNLIKHTLFIVGVIIMMLSTHVTTALYVIGLLPVVVVFTFIFKKVVREAYRRVRDKVTQMNTFLAEHLSGMRIIQTFTREESKVNEMKQINDALYVAGMRELTAFALFRPVIFVLSYVALGLVLLKGGESVLAGTMTAGALVIMVSYTKDFFGPIEQLADSFNVLQSAFASAEKIFSILDEENEIIEGDLMIPEETFKGEIEFKNVWFAYNEEEWILKDVSFKVEKGQKVAFVGATGAGKTSILSLICRDYDIQKGQILIDGKDIKSYKTADLRRQIGQVLQDVFLFTGDIKHNICLGNETITQEQIEAAAKMVNVHDFIETLPGGYDEKVIERGASLSTGQRQLISFARAIAFDPKIFILDEATANIDTETESIIQDALYKMMEGRTTLMVAHRLSTIQHSDNIIVLDKGVIKESGNHQELLKTRGIYYNLYQLALKRQVME